MLKPILTAAAAASLLSACAGYDLDATRAMAPTGDAFAEALHDAYLERAAFERDEVDWKDARFFNLRAQAAASGNPPAVQELSARGLTGGAAAEGRAALVDRLSTTAPMDTPVACAQAQAWFEHWMEQLEEGHQADHIAEAGDKFNEWLEQCQPAVMETQEFVIYFPHDSASLTESARDEVARAAAAFKDMRDASITLVGHADTSGDATYNQRLSERRVSMVASNLTALGVPSESIRTAAAGERDPAVPTGDGVKEVENRRVTIMVGTPGV